ncbi:MAG: ABC transporter ATP-binding protein [Lentisphaeria bacterium]|nr:ABC transporter ATP-binding protein [Lentisphaeria bacterium]
MRPFHDVDVEKYKKPLTLPYIKKVLGSFVHYYTPWRPLFFLSLFCSLAGAGMQMLIPLCVYRAFQENNTLSVILFLIAGIFVLMCLIAVCNYICTKYGHIVGVRMEADMRDDLFAHLQKLSFNYFDKTKTGHIMSRITNDLSMISELAHHGPEDISAALIMFVAGLSVMFVINPFLTLVTIIPMPLFIFWASRFQGKMRKGFRESRKKIADLNSQVENSIQGIREVKSFTQEKQEIGKFKSVNASFRMIREALFGTMASFHSGMRFFMDGYSLLFVIVGVILNHYGKASLLEIMTFFMYSKYITMPVFGLLNFSEQFHQGLTAYERFYEVLQEDSSVVDKEGGISSDKPVKGDIEFRNVSFSYNEKEEVLKNITLRIPAGTEAALVGESGVGKTTIAALIPRFYDVCSGEILLDGLNVKEYSLEYLRKNIGIVRQTPFLFDTTIRENILFGKPDATEEEMIQAAKDANIYDFIMSLPEKFDAKVGEHGILLSGGQKQRISIARVFLKNPPILIFDEATSALDNQSEELVRESMEKLCRNRTTLIIAHRLSTVKHAEKLFAMKNGLLVEEGSHEALLQKEDGYYKLLYSMHSF